MDHLCFMFVFVILSCLFLAALWSPAGKGLLALLCVMFSCVLSLSHTLSFVRCTTRNALLYVLSSFVIILTRKRELVALLLLSFGCLVAVNVL